jgi:uncharacterized LabA/DUF88 family protein
MRADGSPRKATAFVDGQNLFHAAREAFGYTYPNYDPLALALAICEQRGWLLTRLCFYTGVPERRDDLFWHDFWTAKLGSLGGQYNPSQIINIVTRPLRYRNRVVWLADERTAIGRVGEEKGIDVRIAVDVMRLAHRRNYDVALIFSQDQDLAEVAREIRMIAKEQKRWIKMASAFPVGPGTKNRRGIDRTDWIEINRKLYDQCLDKRDYRRWVR